MSIIIREAKKEDMPEVFRLINELAEFENEADAVEITVDDLVADGFKEASEFKVFLADYGGEVAGMALYYPRYSTWKGRSLHLEDLIVSQQFRGKGVGKALYNMVMKTAYESGINRVEWEVLDWNSGAIDFYKSTGAEMLENWNLCQMPKHKLRAYIENESL